MRVTEIVDYTHVQDRHQEAMLAAIARHEGAPSRVDVLAVVQGKTTT